MVDPLQEVMLERAAQDRKWGEQNHPDLYWLGILVEEVGELAQALIEGKGDAARKELVQVTAVGLAWLEALERKQPKVEWCAWCLDAERRDPVPGCEKRAAGRCAVGFGAQAADGSVLPKEGT